MTLSFSERAISIIKGNSFKTSWGFLLYQLPSFFCNKKKLELHKKVCENKDFSNVIMSSKDTKILELINIKI